MFLQKLVYSIMKKSMFFAGITIFFIPFAQAAVSPTPVTVEHCIEKAIDTWTALDTARAIAQEDRRYLYRELVKVNLDLYATIYWFSEHHDATPPSVYQEVDHLLSAVTVSQQDIFGTPKTQEEASLNIILQETIGIWDKFRFKSTRQY
jgi:hypothetical protein